MVLAEKDRFREILDKMHKGEIRLSELDNIVGNKNLGALLRRLYLED
jgi:hypothetical protein